MSASQVMLTPRSVDIAITGRCNLDCKYCFFADEMVALGDLPTDRWLAFFAELGRLKTLDVTLTGGEVFTRRDLFELIDGVIANHMRYSLLSNGTLITEKVLEKFEVGKRRTRLNSIQISIDGSTAEVHNQSRPNSFDRALRGLRLLVNNGFPVTVRVTINRHNVNDLENITRLLLEDVGLPSFSTNEASPCGAVSRAEGGIMLSPIQRKAAMETIVRLAEQYPGRISAQAGPLAMARYYAKIDRAIEAGETHFEGMGYLVGCGCPFSKISVLHDGTIVPCHQLSELHMGTVGVDDFQSVWLGHDVENAMRNRRQIPLSSLETCADCPYQGFCSGGCPGMSYYVTGDINARDSVSCYRVHRNLDPVITPDMIETLKADNDSPKRSK